MEKPLRILFIEDSDDDAELVMRFARQHRTAPEIRRVNTELEVREAIKAGDLDLVITDYNLPSLSGLDVIRIVRELSPNMPLIIVSGTIGEEKAIDAVKAGATDYVLKSNLGRLPGSIERALRETRLERDRRTAQEQLAQSQKMESVGRLAGGVAHDVNNLLTVITLFGEMALDHLQGNDLCRARESIEGIIKSQQTATGIIRQLLLFSRRRLGPPEDIEMSSVLLGIKPLVTRLVGEGIEVAIEGATRPYFVSADKTQLEQILLNLAANARDAMAKGGKLSLGLESRHVDGGLAGARIPAQPGNYVVLTARDTGCGMPPEVQEKLFEPFYTTKEPGKGTGLGLSVIYGILQRAGGTISVTSAPDQGTAFEIYWPMKSAPAVATDTQRKQREPGAAASSATIALVEDEEHLRNVIAAMLHKHGHTIIEAVDGKDGLEKVLSHREQIDLLITDVVMPKMCGPELVKKAREIKPGLCVLFLSGYSDATLNDYEIDPASVGFLEKPFASRALADKVREVLDGGSFS